MSFSSSKQITIRLWFCDFWHDENEKKIRGNKFFRLLSNRFNIILDRDNPDFLIYSVFGTRFMRYDCPRIFYTGENIRPDFRQCDFSFSYENTIKGYNYRLPVYAIQIIDEISEKQEEFDTRTELASKSDFCNFIYQNPGCPQRNQFFEMLSAYKKIDAAGSLFNNTPGLGARESVFLIEEKRSFLRRYKFTIAFENESCPGYTTEKIVDAFLGRTIPIYWGNPNIENEFNSNSFINCHEFKNFKEVINRVIEVDENDDLYIKYLEEQSTSGVYNILAMRERALDCLEDFVCNPCVRRKHKKSSLEEDGTCKENIQA